MKHREKSEFFLNEQWTKPRGRVEAREGGRFGWGGEERWGENADNCN